jgi:alpha-L-fucosidase
MRRGRIALASRKGRYELMLGKYVKAITFLTVLAVPYVVQSQTQDSKPAPNANLPMAGGKFKPADESFKQYQSPDWFRDAKFGIWAHWGPQAVPRQGDWYAKKMYLHEGARLRGGGTGQDPANQYHLEHYGHPSKFGYKDIIPLWKAERWNPDQLMALYKKAGAKYFVSMGSHHDNFFLWNSKLHRWNSVQMGPKKDVVGLWQKAAKKQGLRFGVSEHLGASYTWFQSAHSADATGPMAGVPYDGNDPKYEGLYHGKAAPDDTAWLTKNPVWQREWFDSIKELIDNYKPDLLYSDSAMPFENVGRSLIAHYYNQDMAKNGGKLEAVYTCKQASGGKWVRDIERGVEEGISPEPWQTDTSIGDWYYRTGQKYKTSAEIVQMLTDIVSKNGNLLINIVQTPEGDLEPDMLKTLDEIAAWIAVNGEGIYSTRPWVVYGEGPSTKALTKGQYGGLRDVPDRAYTAEDFRFTRSKDETVLYAFCLGKPASEMRIASLARNSKLAQRAVASVQLLGSKKKLDWRLEDDALVIKTPADLPASPATGLRVAFTK